MVCILEKTLALVCQKKSYCKIQWWITCFKHNVLPFFIQAVFKTPIHRLKNAIVGLTEKGFETLMQVSGHMICNSSKRSEIDRAEYFSWKMFMFLNDNSIRCNVNTENPGSTSSSTSCSYYFTSRHSPRTRIGAAHRLGWCLSYDVSRVSLTTWRWDARDAGHPSRP